ncbi:gliding motility-associated C-terminal domain-containing protein [Hymenobacter sp. BRD67]|uniref:gliding motility-associated C-terminal domain-containing protein n=1 Tax=Hymenobacter sp. BRD67 TaxID=2675877 RepID=UPI0015660846|nr:gliding motility-associated C-terminal domain-containing protein [Hymenobacter sp. BRD67]QKG51764.1 gliding motility-associated C-terminal domain-containing protein [Hymenobacter sp. BRD67]
MPSSFVTVSELTNPTLNGGTGTVYARNFTVYNPVPPIIYSLLPCVNNTALLIIGDHYFDQYFAQVNNGPRIGPLYSGRQIFLPAAPGSTVTVTGSFLATGLCEASVSQVVPALPASLPALVLSRLTITGSLPGSIQLAFSGLLAPYEYSLEQAAAGSSGSFKQLAMLSAGAGSLALTGATAGVYRLRRRDVCHTDSAFSAPVPTIVLSGASLNNVNTLTWQTAGPVDTYTLLRDGKPLTTLAASATSYVDAAVTCGTSYTYELQAIVARSSQSVSNDVPVQTRSTLAPPAPLLNASFDLSNRLVLTASLPGGGALPTGGQILYSRQGGPAATDFGPVPTATDTLHDPAALADLLATPPCYTARLLDVCGNTSPTSPPTCPSLLTVAAVDPEGLTARLSWTAFRGPGSPAAGVSYRVISVAADGTVLATSAPTTALSYLDPAPPTDRQVLRYRIEASGAGLPAGTVSYSNVASLARQPRVVVPNAFTPNGDGLNDVLELKGRYLTSFTFVVVDRNGQEVFRATDRSQTWDGTIQGHAPVNGAYVWRFTMREETGQNFSQTGTVTILK